MSVPISPELAQSLNQLSSAQLAFVAGFAWARSLGEDKSNALDEALTGTPNLSATTTATERKITILSASQTGNARSVANQLLNHLKNTGITATISSVADYKIKQLAHEDIVLLISSTQGEGEAPEEAIVFYKALFSKKAPDLSKVHFSILALGDSSYPDFCQAGKDFDAQFAALGGKRLSPLALCDLDFQDAADAWLQDISNTLQTFSLAPISAPTTPDKLPEQTHHKDSPFRARILTNQKITANEANKDVRHLEIDLADSGIQYQAGDALGVIPINSDDLVKQILEITGVDAAKNVVFGSESGNIFDVLKRKYNITQNTPHFMNVLAQYHLDPELQKLLTDKAALNHYIANTPPVIVLKNHTVLLTAEQLLSLFRKQTPRLYSIASSQCEVDNEVHMTLGTLTFEKEGQIHFGAASHYLSQSCSEGDEVDIFIEKNTLFRLPEQDDTPIIMIGAGTGIAPFRAFMQERDAKQSPGKNWLIFGNQKFTDDFLYQSEWLQYRKQGLLNRADLAWSRQGEHKVYVQHKLAAAAADVWQWLQDGAHIYVCGDAKNMAKDVEATLIDIICQEGKMSQEDAQSHLDDLRSNKRYQRDVY